MRFFTRNMIVGKAPVSAVKEQTPGLTSVEKPMSPERRKVRQGPALDLVAIRH
jgi:hypothetical protein